MLRDRFPHVRFGPFSSKRGSEGTVKTLTAKYQSSGAARNAYDDLIGTGYPSETVYLDRDNAAVKVITAPEGEREAREILGRHQPSEIIERTS